MSLFPPRVRLARASRRTVPRYIAILAFLIPACGIPIAVITSIASMAGQDCSSIYVDSRYEGIRYVDYSYNFNRITPNGVQVDDSGTNIDLGLLDKMTDELSECLTRVTGTQVKIRGCGFRVKIAPDAVYKDCAGGEVFACHIKDATCGCAGVNQWPSTMVIATIAGFKHELIHIVTHKDHIEGKKDDPVFGCQPLAPGGVL